VLEHHYRHSWEWDEEMMPRAAARLDRWLGGVHLKGEKAAWRWDRASQRIVSHQ